MSSKPIPIPVANSLRSKSKATDLMQGRHFLLFPIRWRSCFKFRDKDPKAHFDYIRLPVACHYFWEDGTQIKAFGDTKKFAAEVESKLGEPASHVFESLQKSAFIYESPFSVVYASVIAPVWYLGK
jgi:hypothetical protein